MYDSGIVIIYSTRTRARTNLQAKAKHDAKFHVGCVVTVQNTFSTGTRHAMHDLEAAISNLVILEEHVDYMSNLAMHIS